MLKISNISKTFLNGTINEKTVIRNLSLEINDGDFITVIGGNGAGKTTLLNLIAGVYTPDEGSIVIDDVDITYLPEHKRAKYLGRVFQDPLKGTAGDMTILENLALSYRRGKRRSLAWGILKNEKELFREAVKDLNLGLENRLNYQVGLLSGGQRQALTLIMATLIKPRLLLLDEHTAALDPKTATNVLNITNKIVLENKIPTLMITHNMQDAISYGNRIIMMHNGQIILDIRGEEKQKLTVSDLIKKFEDTIGEEMSNDRMMLK